MTVKKQCLTNL